jgi:hypothetical protein
MDKRRRKEDMKKSFWSVLPCLLLALSLLMAGCSSSGTAGRASGESSGKTQETASVPEEGILSGNDSFLSEGEPEEGPEDGSAEGPEDGSIEGSEDRPGEGPGAGIEKPENVTEKATPAEASGQDLEGESPDGSSAEALSDDGAVSEQKTEAPEQKKEKKEDRKKVKAQEEDGEKETKEKNQGKKKEEKNILKEMEKGLEGEYIPEGFSPEGNYVLVYDSGYTVKTRLSQAGLTYYWGSEEFFFKLKKDLPDMKAYVSHMLFNTAAPMTDPGDEVFPYDESYVINIDLDNGSSYQVSKYSLDLTGRVFVRELFESFRQRWEGTF